MTDTRLPTALATVPRHVAIIMDGNNRWAKRRGLPGSAGHRAGVECIRGVLRACRAHEVEVLTLFAFSSENWSRPNSEVAALMQLFSTYLNSEVRKLHRDNVRLRFVGQRTRLKPALLRRMQEAEQLTATNSGATLVIAVDYGGRWDIAEAARAVAREVAAGRLDPELIDERLLDQHTALNGLPAPDLLIRTAGEQRISNFLLWQAAYAEFYFTETLWPDFDEREMERALLAFGNRERRFGGRLTTSALAEVSGA